RPVVRLSAAGEGAFTVTQQNPQPLFFVFLSQTCGNPVHIKQIKGLDNTFSLNAAPLVPKIAPSNRPRATHFSASQRLRAQHRRFFRNFAT
ncbi:hypothetical protein VK792_07405, partial [Mesobacterium sp. TK19101]